MRTLKIISVLAVSIIVPSVLWGNDAGVTFIQVVRECGHQKEKVD